MFVQVSDETSQKLGILVHQKKAYRLEGNFLSATAQYDLTSRDFNISVFPNYDFIADLKVGDPQKTPNAGKWKSISLGEFPALDLAEEIILNMEECFKDVLKRYGAEYRRLIESGNTYHFLADEKAATTRLGDAVTQARTLLAFEQMRQDKPLDHHTIVGRIMPVFCHALGFTSYHVDQDLTQGAFGAVTFMFNEIAIFKFYKPLEKDGPAYFQRYSYRGADDYELSFEGETRGEIVHKGIFEWLSSAAQERGTLPRTDYEGYMGELALDIRRDWVRSVTPQPSPETIKIRQNATVFRLDDFRRP